MAAEKPAVVEQGSISIQTLGKDVAVLFPGGELFIVENTAQAMDTIKTWLKKHLPADKIGVAKLTWRSGLKPPAGKE